jgi:hypothetical protein
VEADESQKFPAFGFTVSAEHLFGGAAHNLACEGAVVFEDVPFAPEEWKGWRFGNDMLGLKPSFRRLKEGGAARLDRNGAATFPASGCIDFNDHPDAEGEYLVAKAADLTVPDSFALWAVDEDYCAQGDFRMNLFLKDGKVYLRVRKVRGMTVILR